MTAPDGLAWLTLFASLLAAMIVSGIVSVRSAADGDSLAREWCKRGLYGTLAMIVIWGAYFIIGNIAAAIGD